MLFVLTGAIAAIVFFLQYRLQEFRNYVQHQVEVRLGAQFEAGKIHVNGLRGLRIDSFHARIETEGGPTLEVEAPVAYLYLDLIDLIYGQITVDLFQVDDAEILISKVSGKTWFTPRLSDMLTASGLDAGIAFRVSGERCRLELAHVTADSSLSLDELDFKLSRLQNATDLLARVSGRINGAPRKQVQSTLRYAAMDDFDLRTQISEITAEDINIFLPPSRQILTAGTLSPQLRVSGFPGNNLIFFLTSPFQELSFRNQPAFIPLSSGSLQALTSYDGEVRVLSLSSAKIHSEEFDAKLEGSVTFSPEAPQIALTIAAQRAPLSTLFDNLVRSRLAEYGALELEVGDPYQLELSVEGTMDSPRWTLSGDVGAGSLSFTPLDEALPEAALQFSAMSLTWASGQDRPRGSLRLTDGTVSYAPLGLKADTLSGALTLDESTLTLDPIQARVSGYTLGGQLQYDLPEKRLTFSTSGMLQESEDSFVNSLISPIDVTGLLGFRCSGEILPNHYSLDLSADATQARVGYEWWLQKREGIGAVIQAMNIDITPGKSMKISGTASLDTCTINTTMDFSRTGGKWQLNTARAKTPSLEADTANKCLSIPYWISGGIASDTELVWQRTEGTDASVLEVTGTVDRALLRAKELEEPFDLRECAVKLQMTREGEQRSGALTLNAAQAQTPPFGVQWLVPMRPGDPELAEKYPEKPRAWEYTFSAQEITMSPWSGTSLEAKAVSNETAVIFPEFKATVGEGSLAGSYQRKRSENTSSLNVNLSNVPAVYVLRHLGYPELLTGTLGGTVNYSVDADDPGTLQGEGNFNITEGRFSIDALNLLIEDRIAANVGALPPSLHFDQLAGNFELQGDRVNTPSLNYDAEGLHIGATGYFIFDGDMDYTLNAALTPELADRVPILKEYFNIEGHRLTQNQLELAFRVNGPTFKPSGSVAGLPPVGVTLVSGAFEVTSEAVKVIDIPRQILLDLFRIGGGIVGASR